jgi:hypothetical protein
MRTKFIILTILLVNLISFGQSEKNILKNYINFSDLPKQTLETPSWAIPFYTNPDNINVYQMKNEIDKWIKSEQAKKYGKEILIEERKAKGEISSDFSNALNPQRKV